MEDNSSKINMVMAGLMASMKNIHYRSGWASLAEKGSPEGLEQLLNRGVIDLVDFYFLLAVYYGETPKLAASFVNLREQTGRERLASARDKVREYLREIPEPGPVS